MAAKANIPIFIFMIESFFDENVVIELCFLTFCGVAGRLRGSMKLSPGCSAIPFLFLCGRRMGRRVITAGF